LKNAGGRRFRALFIEHEHVHLRAECVAVEFECLFATAAEEQVGLDDYCFHSQLTLSLRLTTGTYGTYSKKQRTKPDGKDIFGEKSCHPNFAVQRNSKI